MEIKELETFENEFFSSFQLSHSDDSQNLTDDQINDKYLKGEVRIVTEQARYPLNTIKDMFSSNDYILNPEFQRRHRWSVEKQSKLIESFIMNVPIPPIFLYEKDFSVYEVMDGLQRISAIKDFYEDKYQLQGLEIWPELNDRKYSNLPDQIRKGIDRRYISSIVLLKETAKSREEAEKIKQMVFSRINSGGAKLEDQEYRNAQCSGMFNRMIINLARNEYFCYIFDIPQKTNNEDLEECKISEELKDNSLFKTMKDVEIVLRFFALRRIKWMGDFTLSKFLDMYAYQADKIDDMNFINSCKQLFEETIKFALELLGDKAFCLYKSDKNGDYRWTKRPTMIMYDALMNVLSKNLEHKEQILNKKEQVIKNFEKLFSDNNNDVLLNGRDTSRNAIQTRINIFNNYFQSIVSDEHSN